APASLSGSQGSISCYPNPPENALLPKRTLPGILMATQVQHPIWLPAVPQRGARTFAALYAVESFARASISSVIPIQAYDLLHNEQEVSLLYTLVAFLGLSVTLSMPFLIERFARRWVYTAGATSLIVGSAFLV